MVVKALTDLSKAAHEIIEVLEDGGANSGLQPANKNPWYVLATIYGEYRSTQGKLSVMSSVHPDHSLYEKNRRAWNGWFCQNLTDEEVSNILMKKFQT